MGREAELIAAIARDPVDAGPRLVLADYLQTSGDPRGELIAIGHHLDAHPDDVAARARELELVAVVERGIVGLPPRCVARWDRGFVDILDLTVATEPFDPDPGGWLSHGALGLVRELWLDVDNREVLAAVAETAPSTVRRLHVSARHHPALHKTLQFAVAAFPKLDALSLGPWSAPPRGTRTATSTMPSLAEILGALPTGRFIALDISAQVGGGGLDAELLAILRAWPLERLVLGSTRHRGLEAARRDLAPILDGAFPRLRHLGLIVPFSGELLEALPAMTVFGGLEALTVNRLLMSSDELDVVTRRRGDYARIRFVAPSASYDLALATADLLRYELARSAEAAPIYEEALRIDPGGRYARFGLASIHQDAKDYGRALGEIERGIASDPVRPTWEWFTWQRSKPLQMMGRHDEARVALEAAVVAAPNRATWWNHLGVLHAWSGRWDAALAAWIKARDKSPNPTPSWLQRFLAQTFVHVGNTPEALAITEPVLAAEPDDWHFGFLHGLALVPIDPVRALDAFRVVASTTKPDAHFIMDRAQLGAALALLATGDTAAAVEELETVARTTWCPAIVAPAWALAGCALRAAGQTAEADAMWRRCVPAELAPVATADAIAALASALGNPTVHASAACEVPGAWTQIHCALVAMLVSCLVGDTAGARARGALLADVVAPIDLGKTCAGSLTRRWPVWQLLQVARPWLPDEDAALLDGAYATAGSQPAPGPGQ